MTARPDTTCKHDLSATAVYALPVGRGQEFLSNANRVMDEVHWRLEALHRHRRLLRLP